MPVLCLCLLGSSRGPQTFEVGLSNTFPCLSPPFLSQSTLADNAVTPALLQHQPPVAHVPSVTQQGLKKPGKPIFRKFRPSQPIWAPGYIVTRSEHVLPGVTRYEVWTPCSPLTFHYDCVKIGEDGRRYGRVGSERFKLPPALSVKRIEPRVGLAVYEVWSLCQLALCHYGETEVWDDGLKYGRVGSELYDSAAGLKDTSGDPRAVADIMLPTCYRRAYEAIAQAYPKAFEQAFSCRIGKIQVREDANLLAQSRQRQHELASEQRTTRPQLNIAQEFTISKSAHARNQLAYDMIKWRYPKSVQKMMSAQVGQIDVKEQGELLVEAQGIEKTLHRHVPLQQTLNLKTAADG